MKKQFFKHTSSYASIRSSILACGSVIVSVSGFQLCYWWQLALALLGLITAYYAFDVVLSWLDYLFFYKLAKADIVMDNEESIERLLEYVDDLYRVSVSYDESSSSGWKEIEIYRMQTLHKKAVATSTALTQLNNGPIKIRGQTFYNETLMERIQSFLAEIQNRYAFLPVD